MKKAAIVVLSIVIPVFVVLSCMHASVVSDHFFFRQYQLNHVSDETEIEEAELMRITDEIQLYLLGKRPDFIIDGTVDGRTRQVFNEREVRHMEDVRRLFAAGLLIRNAAGILLIVLAVYLWKVQQSRLFNAMLFGSAGFFCLALAAGLLFALDFQRYFILFHEVFFTNDLWLLDPQTSILINMVPLPFFTAVAQRIMIHSAVILAGIGAAGFLGGRRMRQKNKNHSVV